MGWNDRLTMRASTPSEGVGVLGDATGVRFTRDMFRSPAAATPDAEDFLRLYWRFLRDRQQAVRMPPASADEKREAAELLRQTGSAIETILGRPGTAEPHARPSKGSARRARVRRAAKLAGRLLHSWLVEDLRFAECGTDEAVLLERCNLALRHASALGYALRAAGEEWIRILGSPQRRGPKADSAERDFLFGLLRALPHAHEKPAIVAVAWVAADADRDVGSDWRADADYAFDEVVDRIKKRLPEVEEEWLCALRTAGSRVRAYGLSAAGPDADPTPPAASQGRRLRTRRDK